MIYEVTLNGKIYEVEVEKGNAVIQKEYEAALPKATPSFAAPAAVAAPAAPVAPAAAPAASANALTIKAPLPGNINAVKVTSGQKVTKGTVLLILEAMKMENEITAQKDGTIGQIFVQKGSVVETGASLIEIL